MRFALALAALAGLAAAAPKPDPVAAPKPQGVTASLFPSTTPAGCASTYDGGAQFQIGIVNQTASSKVKRQSTPDTVPGHSLYLTLLDGTLKDENGNTGYIAANGQLQFDENEPQTGAVITTGWSACPNGTLGLLSTIFYECLSGSFYNLYDHVLGDICYPVNLAIIGGSSAAPSSVSMMSVEPTSAPVVVSTPSSSAVATPTSVYTSSAAPVVTSVASVVSQVSDSQPQAPTAVVTQITDGQIQGPTNGTSLMPYNPNAAPAIFVSGSWLALVAGVVGFAALLL